MPFKSVAQRGFIHAKADAGAPWAAKFADEADKMAQPDNEYAKGESLLHKALRHKPKSDK